MAGASVKTLPAPVGGMNALDSIIGMPDTDAISLINLFPQAYGCYLRKGYQDFATGLGGEVQTLLSFANRNGGDFLYGFAAGKMFNATAGGVVGAPLLTSLVSNIWQFTQFGNSAGTHAIGFSGVDDGIWINQTLGVQRLVLGDGIVNATWKNVDPKNLIDVVIHQRRVWAVEKDTTYGWYLPVDQVYGIASKFDFGPLFRRGGFLQSLATWTVDDGNGSDDHLLAISSKGEVAVYTGIDPSAAATWALQGVYYAGEPVSGRRFHSKVAGDVQLVTQQGLVSVNDMLTSNTVKTAGSAISAQKVQQPLSDAASLLSSTFAWQCFYCAPLNMLMINVPSVTSAGNMQFVENTINSGWCQFAGYDASHFVTHNKLPFYGTKDGKIVKGWTGHVDNVSLAGTGGTEVVGYAQQAYSFLEAPAIQKQIGMYRPTFLVESDATYGSLVAYDFVFRVAPFGFAAPVGGSALWDVSSWDAAYWAGGLTTQRAWSQAEGMGTAVSFCYSIRSRVETLWVSTDYTYKTGGVF